MIKVTEKATLLTAESKPYKVDGNEGVSHKVRVLVTGEIYSLKATEEQVLNYKPVEGETGEVTFILTSKKENLKAELVAFEPS